ncbi:presequence translocase-associated motor subunit [Colletotrichum musicola]|uniref:Presequence translocated-associated motor subunit PAM17 n=1 Tax=Colletotrichum musicola TaxID=2175873 RepID=A0A8H6KTX7_9PEZI|nr:presequence translocase-associated motor subunit [Colletotrichum musicola]
MLTPTSTFALRMAGQGAARASVASSFARTATCPYSTVATKTSSPARPIGLAPSSPLARAGAVFSPSPSSSMIARVVCQPCSQRRTNATAASTSAAASSPAAAEGDKLDWNTFFALRKSRRRWQLGFSVVTFGASFVGGAGVLATGLADPLVSQVPLDPFITLGLMTFSFGALGWLAGPSVGSLVFYTLNKRWKNQMTVKEKEFFARIKKNRVDPSVSSVGNPVPDFYGEKISSVAGYRQWLKDQRAFNRKRLSFA